VLCREFVSPPSPHRCQERNQWVTIYTEKPADNKALTWAREIMRDNPDPQAYLAAVHARLGQWHEARKILEQEINQQHQCNRAVTLRWQLAEVSEKRATEKRAERS